MKLYKDGKETLVDKPQLKILLDAGWSRDPDAVSENPSEEIEETDDIDEVKVTAKPKKMRKPKKITKG